MKVTQLDLSSDTAATSESKRQFFQHKSASEYAKLPQRDDLGSHPSQDDDFYTAYGVQMDNHFNLELSEEHYTDEHYSLSHLANGMMGPDDDDPGGFALRPRSKEKYKWRAATAFTGKDKESDTPHLIFFTMHGIKPDASTESEIARTELLLLIDVMMDRMTDPALFNNTIYPVLLVSICAEKVRLIQGYFEAGALHIQYSPFLNYEPFDKADIDILLRWTLGDPIGDTTTPTGNLQHKDLIAIRDYRMLNYGKELKIIDQ